MEMKSWIISIEIILYDLSISRFGIMCSVLFIKPLFCKGFWTLIAHNLYCIDYISLIPPHPTNELT